MQRRTWRNMAGPWLVTLASTAAAVLASNWSAALEARPGEPAALNPALMIAMAITATTAQAAPAGAGAVALGAPLAAAPGDTRPARVTSFTNEDLDRVHPLRDETGVGSRPAFGGSGACAAGGSGRGRRGRGRREAACADDRPAGGARSASSSSERDAGGRGEAYWRREARRVREKLRPWRQQVEDLELQIAERRRQPGVRPYSDPQIVAWERRADTLRARLRETEDDLDERARRAQALPGWLR